mgnify:CR=1 FL=1
MLILTRNVSERIFINDKEVIVTVLKVNRDNSVKIGLTLPKGTSMALVDMSDVYDFDSIR